MNKTCRPYGLHNLEHLLCVRELLLDMEMEGVVQFVMAVVLLLIVFLPLVASP